VTATPQPAADPREGRGGAAIAMAAALGVEVTALLEEPAPRSQTDRGRPPKPAPEPPGQPALKRPREGK